MTRWPVVYVMVFLGTLTGAAHLFAQLPPDKGLESLKVADGLQVELFAAEPMVINPTSMDIDHKGRVWIAEAVNYRRKMRNQPLLRDEGDRIVVLTDTNEDGKADEATTFYQSQELYGPLSVCVIPQPDGKALRVLVAQSPDILEFWDRDGDLKADGPPTKFLTGFKGFDHDHGVHGLSVGPDGKLYFTVGDQGVDGLQSTDGQGPKYTSNNTDLRAGTVWRCDLDGTNIEPIAHNFRNNYEACVNSFGEIWCSDNDDDGNQQTRICFVMPGGNYGYHPRGKGESHWHEEQPGIVHKTLRTGFGSPTGICFYEGDLLSERYHGQLLHTDAGPRELRCFHLTPKGAGYELQKENLLTSSDNWFRLSDVCVAPDGSVFVCDWYDPGVGGHGMGDWTRGRVYRITPKGHSGYKVPAVELDTKEDIAAGLGSPNLATRALTLNAIRLLSQRNAMIGIGEGLFAEDAATAARAAWALAVFGKAAQDRKPEEDLPKEDLPTRAEAERITAANIEFAKRQTDDRVRNTVLRIQSYAGYTPVDPRDNALQWLERAVQSSPAVQREYLILSRQAPIERLAPYIHALAKQYDGEDIFYLAALNIALGTDPARRDAILADFDKHFPEWNDTVADLVWELRPKSVLPRLEKLLADGQLTGPQKARIVDILAVSDDPAAGKTLLTMLTGDAPAEVKASALDNLRQFLPTKWNRLTKGDELKTVVDELLADAALEDTGLKLVAAANYTPAIDRVEAIAGHEKMPRETRLEAVRTLGQLNHVKAVDALIHLGQPENPLSVAVVKALGEHLPAGGNLSPAAKRAMDALQLAITLDKGEPALRRAALEALAGSRTGTDYLIALKEKGELPASVAADAGRLLRNSPFQGQRNKAMLLFPAPGKLDPKKLPPIGDLITRSGNADKGRDILAKSIKSEAQCLKCHMVRGQGGQIGPDLSMVGKKGSLENLFESLLVPSKAIADQYVSWKIDTIDGQSLVGLIVAESESTVVIRDANGKDYKIPTADIDGRSKSLVSLMPENLVAALTEDELIDVVAFLKTLQTPSLTPDSWLIAGPYPAPTMQKALAEVQAIEPGENGPATGAINWDTIQAAGNGYFDLAAHHGAKAANSASYLARDIESPADQEATFLLGTDDGARLWVNGKEVWHTDATRAAAPEQDRVTVKLKKGPNAVLLKVANGGNPHGFYLTITSEQELKLK